MSSSWYIEDSYDNNDVILFMNPIGNSYIYAKDVSLAVQIFCAILFTCAIQDAQTMGLHSVELLVNISRGKRA
jgi:hypothetical protein